MWYKNSDEFKTANGYEIDGVWYPRVTKILDIKAKPGLEAFWKETESYAQAEDIKNKSAALGTMVHEVVQKISVGETPTIPKEIYPAVSAFEEFNAKHKILFYPEFIERKVWSLRHKYVGTVDALASFNGKFGVLDIKTSTGFYPEYNLQTGAYVSALKEFTIRKSLSLPKEIETRWILRIDQSRFCKKCSATLREKGGRKKIRNGRRGVSSCVNDEHEWGEEKGLVEIKEFPYFYDDIKAFIAAKILWEWENNYWLKQVGYLK